MSDGMDKKTILKGMWWVKGNEDEKFTGILTYGSGYVPTLEIFLKEFDWDKPKVPQNSTIYGDVFGESTKIEAVTLLDCRSQKGLGTFTVGAYYYRQEFVSADCVAIGMLLDDDEIAQVQTPQNIYLTCTGLDEYSFHHAIEHVWKDNIPNGRAYRVSDLEKIVYTQPDQIAIEIEIGTITISQGHSSTGRGFSTRYGIHIGLANPTPKDAVNSLIYSQLLSFLSIMTGRGEYIEGHSITIDSDQTNSDSLSLDLNYGHITHSTRESEHSMLQALLTGTEENIRKFATLFPKWRENFAYVKELAFHHLHMTEQSNEINLLQAFFHIETYVHRRLMRQGGGNAYTVLTKVINSIADYFPCSSVYSQHFPKDRRDHIVEQLARFRNKRVHSEHGNECKFTPAEVYAYIDVILRSIFLREMEYSYEDIDNEINHWRSWRQIDENKQ